MSIDSILSHYSDGVPAAKTNLARILMHGRLGSTGRMVILPVDQGFEHGPEESFYANPDAYDPEYHIQLAIEAGLNAYAAPIGMLECVASKYPNRIPLILKLNNASKLFPTDAIPDQAFTSSPVDALKLGCVGVGLTIYPGSAGYREMLQSAATVIAEAKSYGLVVVVWAYPRGSDLSSQDETALDIVSYAAHMACLIGADIVKVKPPNKYIARSDKLSEISNLSERVKVIVRSCFAGKRLVLFSGGQSKSLDMLYEEVREIRRGGGSGSIIGRNAFQRPYKEALEMLDHIISIYSGQ